MRLPAGIALLLLAVVAASCTAQDEAPPPLTFIHLTDAHVGAQGGAAKLRAALDEIAQMSPAPGFIIDTGDATEFGAAQEFAAYREIVSGSPIPVFTVPGNHDTRWCEEGKERFVRIVGPTQRSFDHMGWHIVMMDTSLVGEQHGYLDPVQIRRLADDLAQLPAGTPVIIAMHHPPSFPGVSFMKGDDALFGAIRPYNVRLILTGHGHSNRTWERDGVQLVMTKAVLDGFYRIVTVGPDTITAAYKMTGYGQFEDVTTPTKRPDSPTLPDAAPTAQPPIEGLRWKTDVGASVEADPILTEDGAFVSTLAGELVRLDPDDGKVIWRAAVGGSIYGSPAPLDVDLGDGHTRALACASSNGRVMLIGAADGAVLWVRDVGGPVVGTPAVDGDRVYVTAGGTRLLALSTADGEIVAECPTGPCQVGPVVDGDTVFVGCWDRRFMAVDAGAGDVRWTKEIGRSRYYAPASSRPLVTDDRVIVTTPLDSKGSEPSVLALDRRSGDTLWGKQFSAGYCSPSADSERLFLTLSDGAIVALSLDDGAELWRVATGVPAAQQHPCVADGCVYVGSLGGTIICVSASSGRTLWRTALGARDTYFFASPVVGAGSVVWAGMDGYVYALKASGPGRTEKEEPGSGE